ncbi:hypothetical protein F4805DRAFT_141925 [Annulohypoxylon moriforme]|nr:hypothetical protein F4805DRAFT_141925 [Annulohypoxylon moriforme]
MPEQTNPIYFQFIDGNSRVHNGNTYVRSASEHNYVRRDGQPNTLTENDYRQRLLRTLSFDQIHTRRQNLREPSPNTCNWIVQTREYQNWINPEKLHAHNGFFWIKGKPGAGKSVLMNYLLNVSKDAMPATKIISYFFNARGHELERTVLGLYQSLLSQLIKMFPKLEEIFIELGFTDPEPIERHGWQIQSLKNLFSRAIEKLKKDYKLVFYIDALDECPKDQVRDIVFFFQELGNLAMERGAPLHTCFSSRHYPNISVKKCIHLNLDSHYGHRRDLARYIDSTLVVDSSAPIYDIKYRILQKASGVFLWVVLTIPMLNKAFDSGKTYALKEQLEKLPSQLGFLFNDMFIRDSEDQKAMLLCIQLVLFARHPLSLQELYFAVNIGLDHTVAQAKSISKEHMNRYILNSSKGLVEGISYSKWGTIHMQFIHESVRDFLLRGNELSSIWPHLKNKFVGESQEEIKRVCSKQIQSLISPTGAIRTYHPVPHGPFDISSRTEARQYGEDLEREFPFLRYATLDVLFHSNEAQHFEVQQLDWIQHFPLVGWTALFNMFMRGDYVRKDMHRSAYNDYANLYTPDVKMLYVLAHQNMTYLLQQSPDRLHHLDVKGGYYGTPLVAALARGCREAARYLGLQVFLDQGLDILHGEKDEAFFSELNPLDHLQPWGLSTFGCLSQLGCITAMQAMWLRGEDIEKFDNNGHTPLYYAVSYRSIEAVRWLCSHKSFNPNVAAQGEKAALFYPYDNYIKPGMDFKEQHIHLQIFRILLEHPKIIADFPYGRKRETLFSHAVGNHLLDIAYALQESGLVDINSRCCFGRTPFHYAALYFSPQAKATIHWLLSLDDIDPNAEDNGGRTPLSYAAEMGLIDNVFALVSSAKVDVESKDKQGHSPLWWAVNNLGVNTLKSLHLVTIGVLLKTGRVWVGSDATNVSTPLALAKSKLNNPIYGSLADPYMSQCIDMMERYNRGESID